MILHERHNVHVFMVVIRERGRERDSKSDECVCK